MYPGTYAKTQPEKLAVARPATGETRSYRELNARSNQLAQLFYVHGLRPGDHVAVYLENHLAYFDVLCACMRSGLFLTPINRYLPAGEAAYIVDDCDAKALVASAELEPSVDLGRLSAGCELKLSVGGPIEGFREFEAALAGQPSEPLKDERIGSLMLYSSGTTGRPKGILRALPDRHPEQGNPGAGFMADVFGFDTSSIYLAPAPMYHAAPLGFANSTIQTGGSIVIMDKFEPELALQLIERFRITHSQWVPAMFIRMLRLDEAVRTRYDLSSHRCAIHAAAPCPVEVKRQMIEWWGPIIEEYYSSTESAGLAVINSEEWLKHPGSVGRPRGAAFHICGDDGEELPPGTPGSIYGEAPAASSFAYHKDPGKTTGARHPNHPNWVSVGDVGYLNDDGYLFLTDRKAFMIISGGVNIYPQQIEDALALHPKIADVAVIGVPNPDLGEEVKAVVEPAPGVEPSEALAQEIKDFVLQKLGRQLTPRTVDFVDALPRLPTGKLYKKALRELYWGENPAAASPSARA